MLALLFNRGRRCLALKRGKRALGQCVVGLQRVFYLQRASTVARRHALPSLASICHPLQSSEASPHCRSSQTKEEQICGLFLLCRPLLMLAGPHNPDSAPRDAEPGEYQINEEELLRTLVQDALQPPGRPHSGIAETGGGSSTPTREKGTAPSSQRQLRRHAESDASSSRAWDAKDEVEDQHSPLSSSTTATAASQCSPAPNDSVSHVRAGNAEYEPFLRVRRKTYQHVVNAYKGLVNLEDAVEWMCTQCQTFNFMKRFSCRHCGAFATDSHRDKHPPARHVVVFPSVWLCTRCGARNGSADTDEEPVKAMKPSLVSKATREKFICMRCQEPFRGAVDWRCPSCHHMNPKAAVQCASCYVDRPVSWTCDGCGHAENSVFSLVCLKCERPQHPVKESDAIVRCPNCATRNDVRWELCESCMAPLPALTAVLTGKPRDSVAAAEARATPPPPPPPPPVVAPSLPSAAPPTHDGDTAGMRVEESPEVEPAPQSPAEGRGARPTISGELSGSWWCTRCNVLQRRNASFCDICLRPRSLAQHKGGVANGGNAAPARGEAGQQDGRVNSAAHTSSLLQGHDVVGSVPAVEPGAWQCPYCRQYNPVKRRSCCGKDREMPVGYWLCEQCCSTNRMERRVCLGCGAAPPAKPWSCPICLTENPADVFECSTCATSHPTLWRCAACQATVHCDDAVCPGCGKGLRPKSAPQVECPVCKAPNAVTRKSCFRCRGRLQEDGWRCSQCSGYVADRQLWRCPTCHAPREFDTREETWICDLCEAAVVSGGSLPTRNQCPHCGSDRDTAHALTFPTRWRCRRCRIFNWSSSPTCSECGGPRRIPEMRATVHCPHCFHRTSLDSAETCEHCHKSLSDLLTDAGRAVSSGGRGIFAALADVEESFGLRSASSAARRASSSRAAAEDSAITVPLVALGEMSTGAEEEAAIADEETTAFRDDSLTSQGAGTGVSLLDDCTLEELQAEEEAEGTDLDGCGFLSEDESALLQATWVCPRCECTNTEEYLACAGCGCSRST